jgi:glycosyltransferase involved in cell wall biosynthesis
LTQQTVPRRKTMTAAAPGAPPTFSVVIPTYNEEDDIGATLARVFDQDIPFLDVIVVDGGSTDGTVCQLRRHAADNRITVLEEGRRRGVAAARNAGIRAAKGDVVVILNADVLLPADFLERLMPLYAGGVDAVSVDSRVENMDALTGRYLQAAHRMEYSEATVGWSEGFSCRRDAAIAAGFPEEIPGAGGEDVEFLARLRSLGYIWQVHYSISVAHRVPPTLRGFWEQFRSRGSAIPYIEHALKKQPLALVTARRIASAAKSLALAAAIVPHARTAIKLARYSPRGLRDAPAFWALRNVLFAAHRVGEWQSLCGLWRERMGGTP